MKVFRMPVEFEWDKGNRSKNWLKHRVSDAECEEVFFDNTKKLAKDAFHSGQEDRYMLIGKTKIGRTLFLVFTMRKHKVRIISARDLNRKEQYLYEEAT